MPGKNETRVAVFLGGRSPEHDVSVITGLQALEAIDQERFVPFPVYVTPRRMAGRRIAVRAAQLPADSRTAAN
jgi:D-alanine-D-alanine ligase